jgi:hypothetical protein
MAEPLRSTIEDSEFGVPLVTNNLAFVSSMKFTYAIDLSTRKVVWTYPLGGMLALSNRGVLYIQAYNQLVAINLQ